MLGRARLGLSGPSGVPVLYLSSFTLAPTEGPV